MNISRRRFTGKFIGLVGGGAVVAATSGFGIFAATRTPEKALAPWSMAGGYTEPRRRALSYAILAPNPHNLQPWLVDLSRAGEITLFADPARILPQTDPYNRQITIGLGCFLELLRMAAAEIGYVATYRAFPLGAGETQLDNRPVATVSFEKDRVVETDPLFSAVLDRRSTKEPFDLNRKVPLRVLEEIVETAQAHTRIGTTNAPETVRQLRRLTHRAMATEIETPRTYKESVELFRIGKSEINAKPDGIDFSGPFFESLSLAGLFSREVALDVTSSGYKQGIDAVMENIDTAMAYVWLITKMNSRRDQLDAGRDWVRINLAVARLGVALQPVSQALQEYPEMRAAHRRLHQDLDAREGTVQMLGRLGYAPNVPPSPRWPLDAKIMKA